MPKILGKISKNVNLPNMSKDLSLTSLQQKIQGMVAKTLRLPISELPSRDVARNLSPWVPNSCIS